MNHLIRGNEYLAKTPRFKLVDREEELQRLSSILIRSKANSVLLVGPGGVGCTALCMGLQASKADPNAPFDIVSKRLFWLDVDGLFSLGDASKINAAFDKIMSRLYRTPESVLIIEDARDFIEAARNIGSVHFLNAIAVAIKNDKTQVIFECRDEDLDYILKTHSDLRELFTLIDLAEPIGEALLKIVENQAVFLEEYHKIKISPDAVKAAVEVSSKYRSRDGGISRAQPERAVTLLDRALSSYRLNAHRMPPGLPALLERKSVAKAETEIALIETEIKAVEDDWANRQAEIKQLYKLQRDGESSIMELEVELEKQLEQEKAAREHAVEEPQTSRISRFAAIASGAGIDSEAVRAIKQRIETYQTEINKNKAAFDKLTAEINSHLELTRDIVFMEFSAISGITLSKLNQDEREKLRGLECSMKKRIFGQDFAVKRIADAVKTARVGRRNQDRPQAAFMLLGPSGVGKTEIAKALAEALLDDEKALTRFDMSEYMEKHAVARMIGAPPGYEGFEAGGILTNAMRKNPNRVLLFDEIEKAHPDLFNIFLQILGDGRLTDNVGRTVNFNETVVIMTTNIGQPFFLDASMSFDEARIAALEEVGKTYRAEFLNRFNGRQNLICFDKLDLASIQRIVRREFNNIDATYRADGLAIQVADDDIEAFCAAHYDPKIGARGLPGFITSNVEPIIVNMILDGNASGAMNLVYDKENGNFAVKQ